VNILGDGIGGPANFVSVLHSSRLGRLPTHELSL
jgi:hypothetical protein